jgi:hypothetical protein
MKHRKCIQFYYTENLYTNSNTLLLPIYDNTFTTSDTALKILALLSTFTNLTSEEACELEAQIWDDSCVKQWPCPTLSKPDCEKSSRVSNTSYHYF